MLLVLILTGINQSSNKNISRGGKRLAPPGARGQASSQDGVITVIVIVNTLLIIVNNSNNSRNSKNN